MKEKEVTFFCFVLCRSRRSNVSSAKFANLVGKSKLHTKLIDEGKKKNLSFLADHWLNWKQIVAFAVACASVCVCVCVCVCMCFAKHLCV